MGAADNFEKRLRKIGRDIEKLSLGEEHEEMMRIFRSIDRLEDTLHGSELRGDPENESRYERIRAIRKANRVAGDIAYQARTEARNREISRLRGEHASRFENVDPYARELAIERSSAVLRAAREKNRAIALAESEGQ